MSATVGASTRPLTSEACGALPQAYDGTIALLTRHASGIPFAEMISHTFRIADAGLAVKTSLDAGTATKVLISNTLGPA